MELKSLNSVDKFQRQGQVIGFEITGILKRIVEKVNTFSLVAMAILYPRTGRAVWKLHF